MLTTFLHLHAAQAISGKDNLALRLDVRGVKLYGRLFPSQTHGIW